MDVCIIPDADIRVLFLLFSAQQAQHYSVRRMRSRMMKSCDQRGLGASPTTSKRQGWYHLALLAKLSNVLYLIIAFTKNLSDVYDGKGAEAYVLL